MVLLLFQISTIMTFLQNRHEAPLWHFSFFPETAPLWHFSRTDMQHLCDFSPSFPKPHHYDFSPEQTCSTIVTFLQNRHAAPLWLFSKDQENPNFWAFDTLGSLTYNPVFEPGRLGKYLDGTEISKLWPKLKILVDVSIAMSIRIITTIQKALKPCKKKRPWCENP